MSGTYLRPPWQTPTAAYSVLLEPPTAEPLTVDEAKLRAALDWEPGDPRDQLMEGYIKAARQKVERDTGYALLLQTRAVFVAMPIAGVVPWPPYSVPMQSIEAIVNVGTGATVDVPPADLAARFTLAAGQWRLEITVGFTTPADLMAAEPLLIQAVGLLTAHYATLGRDLAATETLTEVPMGYEEAVASYRQVWVT